MFFHTVKARPLSKTASKSSNLIHIVLHCVWNPLFRALKFLPVSSDRCSLPHTLNWMSFTWKYVGWPKFIGFFAFLSEFQPKSFENVIKRCCVGLNLRRGTRGWLTRIVLHDDVAPTCCCHRFCHQFAACWWQLLTTSQSKTEYVCVFGGSGVGVLGGVNQNKSGCVLPILSLTSLPLAVKVKLSMFICFVSQKIFHMLSWPSGLFLRMTRTC